MKLWMITVPEHLTLTRSFVLLQIKTIKHLCDNVSVKNIWHNCMQSENQSCAA